MSKTITIFVSFVFIAVIILMAFVVKGKEGDPVYYQKELDASVTGPFESSNTTSRYALVQSIVENNSLFFNLEQAKFSAPDLVRYHDKFFTIFTPGVSLLAIPLYVLGLEFDMPQLFSFLTTIIFAILNVALIARISIKLGTSLGAGLMAGVIFLFGTNALAYSLTLTQHHYVTTVILLMILNAFDERTISKNIWFGILYGVGIFIDVPAGIISLPILFYILWKHLIINKTSKKFDVSIRYIAIWLAIGLIPMALAFGAYNYYLTGSYSKVAQSIGRFNGSFEGAENLKEVIIRADEELPVAQKTFDNWSRFKTRRLLRGFDVLLFGKERSWLYYSPILYVGFLAIFLRGKLDNEKRSIMNLIGGVIIFNIVLYAMFGDVWGGWSFGARYIIPAGALASVFLAIVIEAKKKSFITVGLIVILSFYSIRTNVLGAITTAAIPPKVEAEALLSPIPYTYAYNIEFVKKNISSSLIYNLYLKDTMTVREFWNIYTTITFGLLMFPYAFFLSSSFNKEN